MIFPPGYFNYYIINRKWKTPTEYCKEY